MIITLHRSAGRIVARADGLDVATLSRTPSGPLVVWAPGAGCLFAEELAALGPSIVAAFAVWEG